MTYRIISGCGQSIQSLTKCKFVKWLNRDVQWIKCKNEISDSFTVGWFLKLVDTPRTAHHFQSSWLFRRKGPNFPPKKGKIFVGLQLLANI